MTIVNPRSDDIFRTFIKRIFYPLYIYITYGSSLYSSYDSIINKSNGLLPVVQSRGLGALQLKQNASLLSLCVGSEHFLANSLTNVGVHSSLLPRHNIIIVS